MRAQFGGQFALERSEEEDEDLGWNDMGENHLADVLPLTPANEGATEVHRQQDFITARIGQPVPVRRVPHGPRQSALDAGRRAAFTLRVDAERHLKLRLACTIRNRSAQQLVTEALDLLLAQMPDLESLAAQVKRK
jgi:hypothetical protein